ncbi:DUF6517 family protein [Natronomonas sp. EA1]|uniref:DUF6517 family protein n=1 Tax=Natronomonas sp. EA1 TaxID=3421655 RepID=UPI003EB8279C
MARRAVAALLLVGLMLTSGCIGFLTGGEALYFDSGTVSETDAAKSDTGYELERQGANNLTRTFSVAGQERNVTVTNHYAEYSRTADAPLFGDTKVSRFSVFATPQVEIAGQGPFNPVSRMSNRELVLRLQQQYSAIEDVQFVSNRTVTMLGEETTVSKYNATATMEGGQEVEVTIHITKVQTESDFVIAAAVHPTKVDEQQEVDRMLEGVQHSE